MVKMSLRLIVIPGKQMLTLSVPTAEFRTGKYSHSCMATDSSIEMTCLYGASFIDFMHSFFNFFSKSTSAVDTSY